MLAHIRALLETECGTAAAVAAAAGVEKDTVYDILRGHRSAVDERTSRAVLRLDAAAVRRSAARVPVRHATQRLRSLQAAGWPLRTLTRLLGYAESTRGFPFLSSKQQRYVSQDLDRRIEHLYLRLRHRRGPSAAAATVAAKAGWMTPEHYDDDGHLIEEERRPAREEADVERKAAQRLKVLALTIAGVTTPDIAAAVGVSDRWVVRTRRMVGLGVSWDQHAREVYVTPGQDALLARIRAALRSHDILEAPADELWTALLDDVGGATQAAAAA